MTDLNRTPGTTMRRTLLTVGTSPWLRSLGASSSTRLRIICLPYAGGGMSAFRGWKSRIPDWLEVLAANLPGRETRISEEPVTRVAGISEAITEASRAYVDKPLAIFGHSMGALLAFDVARRLCHLGTPPVHLFVSAAAAPHVSRERRSIHHLPESEFIREVLRFNGTLPGVMEHPELRAIVVPLLRADFAVCESFPRIPPEPLPCPITALGGSDDMVEQADLEAWSEHTGMRFSLQMFPGDHFFLSSSEASLCTTIAATLATR